MKRLATSALLISGIFLGQAATASTEAEPSHFWGGINLKYWNASYAPSNPGFGQAKVGALLPTLVVGYDRFFYTLTFMNQPTATGNNYPTGGIKIQDESSGFGYNVNSNLALVLGFKFFSEVYPANTNRTAYTTLAAVFNWTIPNSEFILVGNVSVGKGKPQQSNPQGQNSYNYRGYELGVSYPIYTSTKVSLGYKAEQIGLPYGLNGNGDAKMNGLFAGIGYSF